MEPRFYENRLPEEARKIREDVFVKEQKFREEFGEQDNKSIHLVLYNRGEAAACGRMFRGENGGEWTFGRIAVLPEMRGKKLGARIVELLEDRAREECGKIGCEGRVYLSAQVRVQGFYEKCGYVPIGEIYMDEHCEHIKMVKQLG